MIVLPFVEISTLKFKAAYSVSLKQNSQCAVQQRTATEISKHGHFCDFTKIYHELGKH